MRRSSLLITIVMLTIIMAAGCTQGNEEIEKVTGKVVTSASSSTIEVKNYTDPEQFIDVGVNEEFVISLNAYWEPEYNNAIWQANYDDAVLNLIDIKPEYVEIPEGLILGNTLFKFRAVMASETRIIMDYLLMEKTLEQKVFTVNIR